MSVPKARISPNPNLIQTSDHIPPSSTLIRVGSFPYQKDTNNLKSKADTMSHIRPEGELEQSWATFESSLSEKFESAVNNLFTPILTMLPASEKEAQALDEPKEHPGVSKVREFLADETSRLMDDCVRWQLLVLAINSEHKISQELQLIKIILSISPYLAFDTPKRTGTGRTIKNDCKHKPDTDGKNKIGHGNLKPKNYHRPIDMIASNGNVDGLRLVLKHAETFCRTQIPMSKDRGRFGPMVGSAQELLLALLQGKGIAEGSKDPDSLRPLEKLGRKAAYPPDDTGPKRFLEAIDLLLDHNSDIASAPDETFVKALENGCQQVINRILSNHKLARQFATEVNILNSLQRITNGNSKEVSDRRSIVEALVRSASSKQLSEKVVDQLIEHDFQELWSEPAIQITTIENDSLLHMAVRHQNVAFVERFLQQFPDAVQKQMPYPGNRKTQESSYYPLWYNNNVLKGEIWEERPKLRSSQTSGDKLTVREQIRNMIVTATISRVPKMQKLCNIFRLSKETVGELCFDLSQVYPKSYRFADFTGSLVNHAENPGLLLYESTIKFAAFPPLDMNSDEKEVYGSGIYEHKEVFDVLDWLRELKHVKKIIELRVPDRLINPHDEREIAQIAKTFEIESLDWRFLDMAISIFDEKVKKTLHTLHLYASGKNAAISHWFSEEGLRSLPNLSYLRIHVIQEFMSPENCFRTTSSIQEKLNHLKTQLPSKSSNQSLDFGVIHQPWNPHETRMADLTEVAEKVVPGLSRFIKSYQKIHVSGEVAKIPKFQATRVAIIDNGILSIPPHFSQRKKGKASTSDTANSRGDGQLKEDEKSTSARGYGTLWSRIKDGSSFVTYDDRVSPWMFASDPHGTQMANLICAIDPGCDIYVAKVAERRNGVLPQRVADAIQWAIEKDVDIISMSFAMMEEVDNLATVCRAAYKKNIVMLCSDHDQGLNMKKAFPSDYAETVTIAACDEYGTVARQPESGKVKHAYALAGLNVAAGSVPFLDSIEHISGSSAATAIAAGLSSLILSCDRIARCKYNSAQHYREGTKMDSTVKHHLDKMKATATGEYVIPEKFGGIDKHYHPGEEVDVWKVIKSTFHDLSV